jgi:hypothetical protein
MCVWSFRCAARPVAWLSTRRRLLKRQLVNVDLETASGPEVLDAIYAASIRRAVFAAPTAPVVFSDKTGQPLRRVAPARDVAHIVRPKSKHASSSTTDDIRNWRATVAQKLHTLTREQQATLLEVAKIRIELGLITNQLAAARSETGRLRRGGREARKLRAHAEDRVAKLRLREASLSDRKNTLVRTAAHRRGLDGLVIACTETLEIEEYCFRETDR